jgi:hypothetical protein
LEFFSYVCLAARDVMLYIVMLLRSDVCSASVLAHITSLSASAENITAAMPLHHLAKPNFTIASLLRNVKCAAAHGGFISFHLMRKHQIS